MKTKALILTLCFTAFMTTYSFSKIWRVNNTGIPADYTTIQQAHDNNLVLAGDTLHIEPSGVSYGSLVSTKKLIVLGTGYFLNENAGQQANVTSATISYFDLKPGSEGTVISGLTMIGPLNYPSYIRTGNISISRNYFNCPGLIFDNGATNSFSNIIVSQNYFGAYWSSRIYLVTTNTGTNSISNVTILNNFISSIDLHTIQVSGIIANNVIYNVFQHTNNSYYSVWTNNFNIKNNIFTSASTWINFYISGSGNSITNNIGVSATGLPTGTGNQNGITLTNIFVGSTGNTTDGQYHLKTGSPAIGAGVSGVDCGIYGGSTSAYKLSGLPAIPSIYNISAPVNSNGNSLPITISVKSNN